MKELYLMVIDLYLDFEISWLNLLNITYYQRLSFRNKQCYGNDNT